MSARARASGWTVLLAALALALPLGALLQPWLWPSRGALPPVPRRVVAPIVLVTVAGLRADRVGHLGGEGPPTPGLDRLAHEGVTFLDFWAASPDDAATAGAILLGRPPSRTGFAGRDGNPPASAPSLPRLLGPRGHHRVALLSDRTILPPALAAAFDEILAPPGAGSDALLELAARAVAARGDVFVWVDLPDLRLPFGGAEFVAPGLSADHPPGFGSDLVTLDAAGFAARGWGADQARWLGERYDGALARLDARLGAFVDRLAAQLDLENLVLCVTGTAGQILDELAEPQGDGAVLAPALLAVPCLLRLPGQEVHGRRVAAPSGSTDLGPTLADLAFKPLRPNDWPGLCGRSLLNDFQFGHGSQRTVYAEARLPGGAWARAAMAAGFQVVLGGPQGKTPVLARLADEPGARPTAASDAPFVLQDFQRRIQRWAEDCNAR